MAARTLAPASAPTILIIGKANDCSLHSASHPLGTVEHSSAIWFTVLRRNGRASRTCTLLALSRISNGSVTPSDNLAVSNRQPSGNATSKFAILSLPVSNSTNTRARTPESLTIAKTLNALFELVFGLVICAVIVCKASGAYSVATERTTGAVASRASNSAGIAAVAKAPSSRGISFPTSRDCIRRPFSSRMAKMAVWLSASRTCHTGQRHATGCSEKLPLAGLLATISKTT